MLARYKSLYKAIIILSIIGLLLPSFGSINSLQVTFAQPPVEAPKSLEGAKEMGEEAGKEVKEKLPGALKKIWTEKVLPFWQKIGNWFKNIWDSYIFSWFENIWQKIKTFFGKEVEKKKPIIEEEFEKEKEEMKEEIKEEVPKVGKSLWERFKELIK